MICPRCGNEWDVTKSPCKRCGLLVRMPRTGGTAASGLDNEQKRTSIAQQAEERTVFPGSMRTEDSLLSRKPLRPQPEFENQASRQDFAKPALPPLERSGRFSSGTNMPSFPGVTPPIDQGRGPVSGGLHSNISQDLGLPQEASFTSNQGISSRPQMASPSRPQALPSGERSVSSIPRAHRLVGDITDRGNNEAGSVPSAISQPEIKSSTARAEESNQTSTGPLTPGTLLRNGRYRLREPLARQEWKPGTYEITWVAQDAQRGGGPVLLREVVIVEGRETSQSILRSATVTLMAAGQLPRIPSLWDAFTENGRNFFSFEPIEGETLLTRLKRGGRPLPENEVIACCLQIVEVLEALSMQKQPVVHGLIRPENIIAGRNGQYALTGFSVVQAGSGGQYGANIDRSQLSVYTAPEVGNGLIDTRSDLYSLLATAYHVVTGSVPTQDGSMDGFPSARRFNPEVSTQFEAILSKGLHPNIANRYHSASELKMELQAWKRSGQMPMGAVVSASGVSFTSVAPVAFSGSLPNTVNTPDSVAQMLPNMLNVIPDEDEKALLPRPEDLPPMPVRNDRLQSAFWFGGIVLVLFLVVLISRSM